jgi:hypothetical protein
LRVAEGQLSDVSHSNFELTIGELVDRFMDHAKASYVHPGTNEETGELPVLRAAFRPFLRMYSRTPAAAFGPLALKAFRKALVNGSWETSTEQARRVAEGRPIGVARSTANHYVARIRALFNWGVSEEFIPVQVAAALKSVAGLTRERSEARETAPVTPVSSAIVVAPWRPRFEHG